MIGIYVGSYLGYLLLFIIGIIVCYCKRKAAVQSINNMDTEYSQTMTGNNNAIGASIIYPAAERVGVLNGSTGMLGLSGLLSRPSNLVVNSYLNDSVQALNAVSSTIIPGATSGR